MLQILRNNYNIYKCYFLQKIFFLTLLLTVFSSSLSAHEGCNLLSSEKANRIKVLLPENPEDRLMLIGALEIDHYYTENGYLITEVSETNAKKLKSLPFKYEIVCDDIAAELKKENDAYFEAIRKNPNARVAFENSGDTLGNIIKKPAAFEVKSTFGGYYSYAEMVAAINNLYTTYPSIVDRFSIGKSYEGRDIWCVKISDNVLTDENEPELGYMGLQHAREAIGGASMIFFMQYLCENYTTDSRIKNLVDNREFFIIPCMNPDGWEYNRSVSPNGGGPWRKNRKPYGANFGADLNRNWGVRWADCSAPISGPVGNCGSSTPSSDTYWGPSAFSEPETQAVRAFTKTRNFSIFLDQHAYGPYYSIPPGRQQDVLSATDLKFYVELCANMGKYNGMKYGNSYEALAYEVAGGVKDWMLNGEIGSGTKGKIYGFTGEGGAGGGTGGTYGNFWPPADKIVILCKGMVHQNLQMAYTAGSYVDHQDLGPLNIPAAALTGNLPFRLRRLGLQNRPVTVSVIPLQNISVGAPVTTSLANFNDVYNGNITYTLPVGIPARTVIKYAWKIETEGCIFYDTITKIYNGSVIISDDMETGTITGKWTSITAGTASSPTWAYTTASAFAGTKSLANAPNAPTTKYGTAAVTRSAQFATNMDLTGAGSAYLSFMVKHRAENFCDKMQVQISSNGTVWTALDGKTTVEEPNNWDGSTINGQPALTGIREEWTREIFDLQNYVGFNNLRLRFVFTSTNTDANYVFNTDNGFYIDDMIVVAGGNPSVTLPLELISFSGRNTEAGNLLSWSTASEINTSHFNIERSVSGTEFETIGMVSAAGNSKITQIYSFTDEQPYSGENLYRLKMMDLDGSYTYSKIISIRVDDLNAALKPTGIERLFPNPANSNLQVIFNVSEKNPQTYSLQAYDVTGAVRYQQQLQLNQGEHTINMDISSLPAGYYVLSVTNPVNRVTYEEKFVKQ
jgi:hypothetical protein